MNIFARIAQMESSRIVGGRAQTQVLLRAPNLTSRTATTGINPPSGSRDARTQYSQRTEIVRMPSGSIVSIPSLEPLHLAEARLKEALLFALPLSILLWILIGLAAWGLISVFL